jgi:hypothetical protein
MTNDLRKTLNSYPNVLAMMDGIPEDLWEVFLPDTDEGLARMEANIVAYKARALDREKAMSLQRLCGFPLRPNVSLREASARARIQGLRNDQLHRRRFRGRR